MENQPTIEEAVGAVLCDCINCISVPLSVLALEVNKPLAGWEQLLDGLEIRQVVDHLGRKAISAADARRLLNTLRRRDELAVERAEQLSEKVAARHPVRAGGVPRVEGATPYESMVAAGGVVTPEQEFGGRPKPRFLQDELEAGERHLAEK